MLGMLTDNQTVQEDSPETVWNAQYRKVFNSTTFLEAKFNGYEAYYNTDPVDKSPLHVDQATGEDLEAKQKAEGGDRQQAAGGAE